MKHQVTFEVYGLTETEIEARALALLELFAPGRRWDLRFQSKPLTLSLDPKALVQWAATVEATAQEATR